MRCKGGMRLGAVCLTSFEWPGKEWYAKVRMPGPAFESAKGQPGHLNLADREIAAQARAALTARATSIGSAGCSDRLDWSSQSGGEKRQRYAWGKINGGMEGLGIEVRKQSKEPG